VKDGELHELKGELDLNTNRLNEVAEARAQLDWEWKALQLIRTGIVSQIIAIEAQRRDS
jgi:hypothetical protein